MTLQILTCRSELQHANITTRVLTKESRLTPVDSSLEKNSP